MTYSVPMVAHSIFCYILIMYPAIFFVISVSALFKNPSYVFLIGEVYSLHTYTHIHTHTHTHIYIYVYIYMYIKYILLLSLLYIIYYYYYYYYIEYYMGSTPLTAPSPSRTPVIQKRGSSVAPWRCSAIQSSRRSTSKLSWPPAESHELGRNNFNVMWILIIKSCIQKSSIHNIYIYIYWHSWLHMCTVHIKIEM